MTNRTTKMIDEIIAMVTEEFNTFGGDQKGSVFGNPIAEALKDNSPMFAGGVDVRDVVLFVATETIKQLILMEEEDAAEDDK